MSPNKALSILRTVGLSLAAILAATFSLAAEADSEIIVIGTVHDPTPAYSVAVLVGILKAVKPDTVLLEGDPASFDGTRGLKPDHRNGLEGAAAFQYQELGGPAPQPFDIEGRDAFYKKIDYYKNQAALLAKLNSLYTAGHLSPEARAIYETIGAFSDVGARLMLDRPEVINSRASDAAMKQKQRYIFEGIARLIELTPQLKEFATYWSEDRAFWHRRNETMIANIISHAKRRRGRIAVLCGFEHRNYILKGLADQAKTNPVSVREYWAQDAQQGTSSAVARPAGQRGG